jgi:hypothetical protein
MNTRLARLQAVTAADVQRVARAVPRSGKRVTARYLAESQRPKGEKATAGPQTASPTRRRPAAHRHRAGRAAGDPATAAARAGAGNADHRADTG